MQTVDKGKLEYQQALGKMCMFICKPLTANVSKRRGEAFVGEASQQSAKKPKRYSNFAETDRADNQLIVTTRVLVKIEGGAKIDTAHLYRWQIA